MSEFRVEIAFIAAVFVLIALISPGAGFLLAVAALPFVITRLIIQNRNIRDLERCIERYLRLSRVGR